MSGRVFLDTNVVVYCFDPEAPEKQARARELVSGGGWVVSWQVIQEFSNVALHRFRVPMKPSDLRDYLDVVLWPRCVVAPSGDLLRAALGVREATGYRFYDSLIVAAALAAEAECLLSEDLQEGRVIDGMEIRSPFS